MFALDQIVPWGRTYDEYRRMFALTDADLALTVLGCADGPASFNTEATRLGARVVSCDPLYTLDRTQIEARISETYDCILQQTRLNAHEFVWEGDIRTPDDLGRVRMSAMRAFLDDFEAGKAAERYLAAELPRLPFADRQFDLALCSHFLFLYSAQLGEEFHVAALQELVRVAREVRVFPLLALGGERSPLVAVCERALRDGGLDVRRERVPYEFQRGGNEMMRITAKS